MNGSPAMTVMSRILRSDVILGGTGKRICANDECTNLGGITYIDGVIFRSKDTHTVVHWP